MTLDHFLGIECFSLKRYTRKNILSKVVLSHMSSYEWTIHLPQLWKWKWVAQSFLTLCDPMYYAVHGILQARVLEWVAFPFSRGSSQPRSPSLQADYLPVELQGKPKNTGVGSLSLVQGIFPTQESNQGLLHCRQILYQLSFAPTLNPINLSV